MARIKGHQSFATPRISHIGTDRALTMSANLTLRYRKAELAYRQARSPKEELACLQEMLAELPKHKGTDKIHADLKQRISRVKKDLQSASQSPKGPRPTIRFPRQGAGRAVIIGAPNSGKSQLLASLTSAKPTIAEYPFSTTKPLPGMMPWLDVSVQLVDTQPITPDFFAPTTQALIRGSDIVLLLLDLGNDDGGEQMLDALHTVNRSKSRLGTETKFEDQEIGATQTKTFLVATKHDLPDAADRVQFFNEFIDVDFQRFAISAANHQGLDALAEQVYRSLDVIRVYTKLPTEKEPDMESPFTIRRGQTLQDLAELVHRDVARNLKGGRVWGTDVFDGTSVNADFELSDGNIVELHI